MNTDLLCSAVDTTNVSLAEETRLSSKLQRVQRVTLFAGLLLSNAGVESMLLQFYPSNGCINYPMDA